MGFGGFGSQLRLLHQPKLVCADFGDCRGECHSREPDDPPELACANFVRQGSEIQASAQNIPAPGGGGGDGQFFHDLKQWLQRYDQGKGKNKGKANQGQKQATNAWSSATKDDQVYRLMGRAERTGTSGLSDKLCNLLEHADKGQKLTSGRAARKQKAKEKKQPKKQSFYSSQSWGTSVTAPQHQDENPATSAGKGKGQPWLPDRSMAAIPAAVAAKRLEEQIPLRANVPNLRMKLRDHETWPRCASFRRRLRSLVRLIWVVMLSPSISLGNAVAQGRSRRCAHQGRMSQC